MARISSAAALCALLAVPVACSSDNTSGGADAGSPDSGTGATGSGGKSSGGSAGKSSGGSGGSSTGGSAGSSAGGTSSGGSAGAATGGSKGGPDAGPDSSTEMPDSGAGGTAADASDGATKPPACPPPTDSSKASVCLSWDIEQVTATADPRLDNKGQLLIEVFDPASATPTVPIQQPIMYPPREADGGLKEIDISELPTIPLDNLPTTVVINAVFIDNEEFYAPPISENGFTYGMYVGGYDLAAGVYPNPSPKPITGLVAGQGNLHTMSLTALRRFNTTIKYSLVQNMSLIGDGQGPLSIGAFDVSAAKNAPVRGGVLLGCRDITTGDISTSGYFYKGSGDDIWLIGDLSDFNLEGLAQPGDVLSLGGGADGQSAPDSQMITVTDAYSYDVPAVTLNVVAPYPGTHAADYHCP